MSGGRCAHLIFARFFGRPLAVGCVLSLIPSGCLPRDTLRETQLFGGGEDSLFVLVFSGVPRGAISSR